MNAEPRVSQGRGELRGRPRPTGYAPTDRDSSNDDGYPSSAACFTDGFSDGSSDGLSAGFCARFAERF